MESSKRKYLRSRVGWKGYLSIGSGVVAGIVRDFSCGGVFFEVEGGFLKGWCGSTGILKLIGSGDRVSVAASINKGISIHRAAVVKWVGKKGSHFGVGLQFEQPMAVAA